MHTDKLDNEESWRAFHLFILVATQWHYHTHLVCSLERAVSDGGKFKIFINCSLCRESQGRSRSKTVDFQAAESRAVAAFTWTYFCSFSPLSNVSIDLKSKSVKLTSLFSVAKRPPSPPRCVYGERPLSRATLFLLWLSLGLSRMRAASSRRVRRRTTHCSHLISFDGNQLALVSGKKMRNLTKHIHYELQL